MTRPVAGVLLALLLLGAPALVLSSQAATTGYLEICKAADGPGVTGTFTFTVAGQFVEVPVGACSPALPVAPGTVTVTEAPRPGAVVTGIEASPAGRLVASDPAGRSAQVTIVAGDVSTQTIVTFANRVETGSLKVCKVAGPGVASGTNFSFQVGGQPLTVPAGPGPGGLCVLAGTFPVGSTVTIDETVPFGLEVSSISVAPPERAGAADLAAGSVVATIGTGVTDVTFTNRQAPPVVPMPRGFLRICKRAEGSGVSGPFTFTVAGQTHDVAVNGCSPVLDLPAGTVRVAEAPRPGTVVAAVEVEPAARLVQADLAGRFADVTVVAGGLGDQTVATFVNRVETGQLKVCKVAGPGVAVGTGFDFRVAGTTLTVPAGPAPGGFCTLAGSFPVGTNVQVSESARSGVEVAAVTVAPPSRAAAPADVLAGTQLITIGTGVTEVTFTNRQVTRGFLRVCKRADGSGVTGTFTFAVGGQTVDVAVNGCSSLLQLPAGTVTVTELPRAGTTLTAVEVAPPDRRVATDLAARSAQVTVVAGDAGTQVVVVFANRADVGVAPPTTTVPAPTTTTIPGPATTTTTGPAPTTTVPPTTTTTATGVSPTTIFVPPAVPPSTTVPPTITLPPITFPPITFPPITLPPITFPPITLPSTTTTTAPPTIVPSTTTTTSTTAPTTTTTAPLPTTTAPSTTTSSTVPAGGLLPTTVPGPGPVPTTTVPTTSPPTTSPPIPTVPATTVAPSPTIAAPTTTTVPGPAVTTSPAASTATTRPAARRQALAKTGGTPVLALLAGALLVLGAAIAVTSRGPVLVTGADLPVRDSQPTRDGHVSGPRHAPAATSYALPPRPPASRPRRSEPLPRLHRVGVVVHAAAAARRTRRT